jgi:hypothetical protein
MGDVQTMMAMAIWYLGFMLLSAVHLMSYFIASWRYWRCSTILVHDSDAHGAEWLDERAALRILWIRVSLCMPADLCGSGANPFSVRLLLLLAIKCFNLLKPSGNFTYHPV